LSIARELHRVSRSRLGFFISPGCAVPIALRAVWETRQPGE
jgi:hypothetical protein